MGRPRNRQRPVTAREPGTDLQRAVWNLELAERRLIDGRAGGLLESVGELEQRLIDPGWQRFTAAMTQEFSDAGRQNMREVCRLMTVANPLLVRATALRSAYIHGGGVQRTARANGKGHDGEQDVQAAVSDFLTDDGNARSFTGPAARDRLEHTLASDGEFFVALITRPLTGEVQTRVVLADEIAEIATNPEDRSEPWFYLRRWTERRYAADGSTSDVERKQVHPCVDYRPATRPKTFAGAPVAWDKPMLHVNVGRPEHWQHGVPDVYSAIPWARAYKIFLEQWASLVAALSKFAWRTTAAGSKQARQIRGAVTAAAADPEQVGQVAITETGRALEAIPKSGATIDSESGRPLAMMVAAAMGVPVTMLLGDPGLTGARATAETLDLPTELTMGQRREVWSATDQRILRYVIAESVRAPRGPLKGTIKRDRFRDRELVELAGDTDATIDIIWPDLSDTTAKEKVDAIVSANATGTIPPEQILRLLLAALGVREADTIIEAMVGADGAFLWPGSPHPQPGVNATPATRTALAPDAAGGSPPAGTPDSTDPAAPGGGKPATSDPLSAAALQHANDGDWAALDADMAALAKAAQQHPTDATPAPQWADTTAVDNDWQVDAALARGADVAAAYGSESDGSDDALRRGYDIAAADAQITGGQAPTFETFAAAANAADQYDSTVQLDNRIAATAMRLGGYAATTGQPITACPYRGDGDEAALRRVWLTAYLRLRAADTAADPGSGTSGDGEPKPSDG